MACCSTDSVINFAGCEHVLGGRAAKVLTSRHHFYFIILFPPDFSVEVFDQSKYFRRRWNNIDADADADADVDTSRSFSHRTQFSFYGDYPPPPGPLSKQSFTLYGHLGLGPKVVNIDDCSEEYSFTILHVIVETTYFVNLF